jgi:O-antigen/teichoic acid export membrane protein
VQATDARREYCFADYFTLRVLTTAFGLLATAILILTLRYDNVMRAVILLIALSKSIECLSDVIGGLLQLHERLDQAAVSLMIRGGLSILAFGATFLWTHSLIACTAAMCFAWLAVLIGYDLRRAKETLEPGEPFFHLDWRAARKLTLLSLPLGFVMMLLSLNANIPRYFLEHNSGTAELGIFASLAYLLVAGGMIVNALGQSATVRLASMFAAYDLDGFRRLLLKLVAIGLAMMVVGLSLAALFGRTVLTLLYRPEYGEHMGAFLILVVAAGVGAVGSFLGTGVTAARYFRVQVPLIAACALTTAVTAFTLIPHYGIVGAALASLASTIVLVIGCVLVLQMAFGRVRKAQSVV